MKNFILIASFLTMNLVSSSQNGFKNSPTLTASNKEIEKIKSPQSHSKSILKIFNYDNNEIAKGIGVSSAPYSLGTFIELPVGTLQPHLGQTIDYLRFGIDDISILSTAKLAIYEDNLENNPVILQTLELAELVKGWNQIKLNQGYTISNKSIYVGIFVETNKGGFTLTYDTDPTSNPDLSGHTILNGTYFGTLSNEVGIDADYNIQALITDGQGADYIDLAILDVQPSSQGCIFSSTEDIQVTIVNKGQDSINTSFQLTVTMNETTVFQQITPTLFYPNIPKTITVPGFDMGNFGMYNIQSSIDFMDSKPENNEFTTTVLSGDAILKIELLTDGYPDETSWKLTDQNGLIVAKNEYLEAETQYISELCILSTQCYTWTINDSNGNGLTGTGSINGDFTLYYNDSMVATSPTNGNFGSEFKVFGIADGCYKNDIKITKIDMPTFEVPQNLPIKGTIYNNGIDTLTSVAVSYKIDDYTSPMNTISGISIPMGNTYNFTHDIPYDFADEKSYSVEVKIINPNQIDENPTDNTLTHKITINNNVIPKRQLIEHFTSSTNDACFNFTPQVDELLANNYDNYSLIRYQMDRPGEGDPYYISQTGDRVDFYRVNEIPSLYWNGKFDMDLSQNSFDTYAEQKTIFTIEADAFYLSSHVSVMVTLNSVNDFDSGLKAYVAILENTTINNVGTNGQTEFYNVLMQLLPSSDGAVLEAFRTGIFQEFTVSYDMGGTFVEEMSDLTAIVFVQDSVTKEVLQSISVPITMADAVFENGSNSNIVFPNPFTNTLTISNITQGSRISISNLLSQKVLESEYSSDVCTINTSHLKSGIYILTVVDSFNNSFSKKIIKR